MAFDSDSELQKYINELSRRTQHFNYEEDSSSSDFLPSDNFSDVEEVSKGKAKEATSKQAISDNALEAKIKNLRVLEEKYIRNRKKDNIENNTKEEDISDIDSSCRNGSDILSDKDRQLSTNLDEIISLNNVMSYSDLVNDPQDNQRSNSVSEVSDVLACTSERVNNLAGVSSFKEPVNIHHKISINSLDIAVEGLETNRKSSSGSLLMLREGIFYSTSPSTDKAKPKIPVFKDETAWIRESDNQSSSSIVKSSTPESVEEEISPPQIKSKHLEAKDHTKQVSNVQHDFTLTTDGSKDKLQTKEGTEFQKSELISSDKSTHKSNRSHRNFSSHKKRRQLSFSSISSESSSSTSSESSSARERKKRHRHKTSSEKVLLDLITNIMIKVIPEIGASINDRRPLYPYVPYPTSNLPYRSMDFGGYTPSSLITETRIEDALRQTIDITQKFMDAHQSLYEAYVNSLSSNAKYSSLNEMEKFIREKRSFSLNEAYKLVEKEKRRKERALEKKRNKRRHDIRQ